MTKFLIVIAAMVLISGLVFGVGFELGGGVEILNFLGIGFSLPTAVLGMDIPVTQEISITAQGNLMFAPASTATAMLLLGGGRYTFTSGSMKPFIGIDGGIMGDVFSAQGGFLPIFGINGGLVIPFAGNFGAYVKAAMRFLVVTSPNLDSVGSVMINMTELSGGIRFAF